MPNETVSRMGDLHGLLAKELTKQINEGTTALTKEGKLVTLSTSPAVLNVARQFLRDNNIECSGASNPDVKSLTESLPFDERPRPN